MAYPQLEVGRHGGRQAPLKNLQPSVGKAVLSTALPAILFLIRSDDL